MAGLAHSGALTKDQSYQGTLDAVMPPVKDGQYRVIVRTDILNEVYEGQNDANNTAASLGTLFVSTEELHLNVPLDGTLSTGQSRVYHVTVDEGETLRVTLTSPNSGADNELFLRYGDVPTGFKYDAIYQNPLQANQTAVIGSTKPGDYYILVRGQHEPTANTSFRLTATTLPFTITGVKPDQGGDSRYVTVTIEGAKFDEDAIVKLSRPGIAEYEPINYEVVNSTKIIAIFDLTDAPHGLYDIKVINPDGQIAIDPYRFLVEQALETDVTIGLGGPRIVPSGEAGNYGVSLQSLTNIDTPYVYFQFGIPNIGNNEKIYGLPFLSFASNVRGSPDGTAGAGVPWASLDSALNTTGQVLAPGYAFDVGAGGVCCDEFQRADLSRSECVDRS